MALENPHAGLMRTGQHKQSLSLLHSSLTWS